MKEKLKQFGIWLGKALGIVALNTSSIVMGVSFFVPSAEAQKHIDKTPNMEQDTIDFIRGLSNRWSDFGIEGQVAIVLVSLICLMISYGVIKFFFMEKRADKRSKEQTKSLADTIKSL